MYFVTSFFFLFYQKILFNVVLISWDIAQTKTLCNVVQEAPDNIAQVKILFNFVLILLGQHCTGKNPVQFCPNTLRTILHRKKILFNFVLILLGQHYTGKNPVQFCPRVSKQHCTRKNTVQFCLNTLGTFHR